MFVYLLRAQKDFPISWNKRLSMSSLLVVVWVAQCSLQRKNNLFLLKFGQGIYISEETIKSIQDVIGDVFCPTCTKEKCPHLSANKKSSFYNRRKCDVGSHVPNIKFMGQKRTITMFGGDDTHCFAKRNELELQKGKTISFIEDIYQPITISDN